MAMLAEKRKRVKYCLNPNGNLWCNDDNKFGQKLLEKMGWQKGQGLGVNSQGIKERIKPPYKFNSRGLGFKEKDGALQQQSDFQNLLNELNNDTAEEIIVTNAVSSLEVKSKNSKSRIHYRKFTRGKDISRYSSKDLSSIIGSTEQPNCEKFSTDRNEKNLINGGYVCEYFSAKERKSANSVFNDSRSESTERVSLNVSKEAIYDMEFSTTDIKSEKQNHKKGVKESKNTEENQDSNNKDNISLEHETNFDNIFNPKIKKRKHKKGKNCLMVEETREQDTINKNKSITIEHSTNYDNISDTISRKRKHKKDNDNTICVRNQNLNSTNENISIECNSNSDTKIKKRKSKRNKDSTIDEDKRDVINNSENTLIECSTDYDRIYDTISRKRKHKKGTVSKIEESNQDIINNSENISTECDSNCITETKKRKHKNNKDSGARDAEKQDIINYTQSISIQNNSNSVFKTKNRKRKNNKDEQGLINSENISIEHGNNYNCTKTIKQRHIKSIDITIDEEKLEQDSINNDDILNHDSSYDRVTDSCSQKQKQQKDEDSFIIDVKPKKQPRTKTINNNDVNSVTGDTISDSKSKEQKHKTSLFADKDLCVIEENLQIKAKGENLIGKNQLRKESPKCLNFDLNQRRHFRKHAEPAFHEFVGSNWNLINGYSIAG